MSGPRDILSRPVLVDKLPRTGVTVAIKADDGQRAAIAERLDLPAVEAFSAEIHVKPAGTGRYAATGEVAARIRQTCVVSMEDFEADVATTVDAVFAEPSLLPAPSRREVERSLDEDDPPEPVENGSIDAGHLAVEFLALALDPFPRKPGAALADGGADEPPASPFAALAALRKPAS